MRNLICEDHSWSTSVKSDEHRFLRLCDVNKGKLGIQVEAVLWCTALSQLTAVQLYLRVLCHYLNMNVTSYEVGINNSKYILEIGGGGLCKQSSWTGSHTFKYFTFIRIYHIWELRGCRCSLRLKIFPLEIVYFQRRFSTVLLDI